MDDYYSEAMGELIYNIIGWGQFDDHATKQPSTVYLKKKFKWMF